MRLHHLAALASAVVLVAPVLAAAESEQPATEPTAALPPDVRQAIAEGEPGALPLGGGATVATATDGALATVISGQEGAAGRTDGAEARRGSEAAMTAAGEARTAGEGTRAMTATEPAETMTVQEATTAAPAPAPDPALASLLAELDGRAGKAGAGDGGPTLHGRSGVNPMARASAVFGIALVLLAGFLAHPRTRRQILARLGAARASGAADGPRIEVGSAATLGTGQKVVTVEVQGVRLLVGVSPGRMDVLHTWAAGASDPEAQGDLGTRPAGQSVAGGLAFAGPAVRGPGGSAAAAPDPQPDAKGSQGVPCDATPSAAALLQAWKQASLGGSAAAPAAVGEATPWWLDGASDDERERLLATGGPSAEARLLGRAPTGTVAAAAAEPDASAGASVAESVIASLRAARRTSGADDPGSTRREPGGADRIATPEPRPRLAVLGSAPEPGTQRTRPEPGRRGPGSRFVLGLALGAASLASFAAAPAFAVDGPLPLDVGSDALAQAVAAQGGASSAVKLLVTLTLVAVAPAIVLSMTSFTRLIVVFSLVRQAIGVQQAPPNQVLVGLALFLTWFVMGPTFAKVGDVAVQPYFEGEISEGEALSLAMGPMRDFMLRNTREKDLALFLRLSRSARPQTRADVPTRALVPAFMISEMKTAFQIGFLVYIPFLIIDLVVATILLAMGMMVLPPIVISLPFKLLVFVFVDGWSLLVGSMVSSFG